MESSGWGCFALVSYVPEPLASCIEEIRSALPAFHAAQPHITILPPRSLRVEHQRSSEYLVPLLRKVGPVAVSLDGVAVFRNTGILYLGIGNGNAGVCGLHDALNSGEFSAPEQYEFVPHVTLGGPTAKEHMADAADRVAKDWEGRSCPAEFTIEDVVALHAAGPGLDWTCIWQYNLRTQDLRACGANQTSRVGCQRS